MMMCSEINIYTLNRIRNLTCCHQVPKDFPVKTLFSHLNSLMKKLMHRLRVPARQVNLQGLISD